MSYLGQNPGCVPYSESIRQPVEAYYYYSFGILTWATSFCAK
jgi:hypothetical protein